MNSDKKLNYNLEKLRKEYNAGEKLKFLFFWGHQPSKDGSISKSFFSQWWKSDFLENMDLYCCTEQYMMAGKAKLFNDEEVFEEIMKCKDPKKIKSLGRKVKNFDEEKWNKAKIDIVFKGNYLKFTQNKDLKEFLLSTGNRIIVEASPYDAVWGIKMSEKDEFVNNPLKWKGENLLGFILMEVRDKIREHSE